MDAMTKLKRRGSGDVEGGAIDSGFNVDLVVQKPVHIAPKTCIGDDEGDPKTEINYYGVGVAKMDE